MAFPVAKLGTLLLKQLSKPIANYAKERAKTHPFFRRSVCMPPAQFYNWCEVKMKMWVLNLGKPVEIPKLNEAMAIELGANLLGETIIFTIAALLLFAEYARQVRKEAGKEEQRKKELGELTQAIQDLYFQAEQREVEIKEVRRAMADLHSKVHILLHRPFGPDGKGPMGGSDRGSNSPRLNKMKTTDMEGKSTEVEDNRYFGGTVLRALDYITFQMPNGYYR